MAPRGALVLAACLLAALAGAHADAGCMTMYQYITFDARLFALKNAIDINGLAPVFSATDLDITLFAPINDAVSVCFAAGCLNVNTLLYHIIPTDGLTALGLMSLGNPAKWQMSSGGFTTISRNILGITTIKADTNAGQIIQQDISTCGGGVIHLINVVLNPTTFPSPPPPSPPQAVTSTCSMSAYDVISSNNFFLPYKALIDRSGRAAYFKDLNLQATLLVSLNLNWPADQPVIAYSQADDAFTVNTQIIPGVVVTTQDMVAKGGLLYSLSGKVLGISTGFDNSTQSNIRLNLEGYVSAVNDAFTNIRGPTGCNYIIQGIQQTFWRRNNNPSPPPPPSPPPVAV